MVQDSTRADSSKESETSMYITLSIVCCLGIAAGAFGAANVRTQQIQTCTANLESANRSADAWRESAQRWEVRATKAESDKQMLLTGAAISR